MKPGAVPMIPCLQAMPRERMGDSAGSVAITRSAGLRALSRRPTPVMVPPVPGGADQGVELGPEVLPDLCCGTGMGVRVGGVEVLPDEEPSMGLGQPTGLGHCPLGAQLRRCQDQLGPEGAHQGTAFLAHVRRHDEHGPITLHGRDHGQADAGVAGGGLDQGVPGLQRPAPLGVLDQVQRRSVLDRPAGVKALHLDPQLARQMVPEPIEAHHRRMADGLEDVLVLHRGITGRGAKGHDTRWTAGVDLPGISSAALGSRILPPPAPIPATRRGGGPMRKNQFALLRHPPLPAAAGHPVPRGLQRQRLQECPGDAHHLCARGALRVRLSGPGGGRRGHLHLPLLPLLRHRRATRGQVRQGLADPLHQGGRDRHHARRRRWPSGSAA